MRNRKLQGILGSFAIILIAGAGIFFLQPKTQPAAQAKPAPSYQTAPLQTGSLTSAISLTGAVRARQTATLTWLTSGNVNAVPVVKDQQVEKDDLLASLDPGSVPQSVILAQATRVSAQKALDNLLTTNQARANAELTLVRAQKALDDAKKARDDKQFQRASEETIDIARANLILADKALEDAQSIYDRNKTRNSDDVVFAAALSQLAAAQQRYDQAQYNLDYVSDLPDPLDVQTAQALVDVAQANLLAAKLEWERDKDGPSDADITAAKAQVDAAQAVIDTARIQAPFNGTLTRAVSQVGDPVAAGMVAFQVDDLSHLYVDGEVPEVDIARVKMGQAVSLVFDALPGQTFAGVVHEIAGTGKTIGGTVSFTVTVEVTQRDAQLRPGMTASARITAEQAVGIVAPRAALHTHSGQTVVYVLRNGQPVAVPVRVRLSTLEQVLLLGDELHAGDELIVGGVS
jgi:HlyD family secretion protein